MIRFNRLSESVTARSELLAAYVAFVWGLWFLNPHSDLFDSAPQLFAPLKNICSSEFIWGALFALLGGCRIFAVFFLSKSWRMRFSEIFLFLWLNLAATAIVGDFWRSPAAPIYFGYAVLCATISIRLRNEIKRDRLARTILTTNAD